MISATRATTNRIPATQAYRSHAVLPPAPSPMLDEATGDVPSHTAEPPGGGILFASVASTALACVESEHKHQHAQCEHTGEYLQAVAEERVQERSNGKGVVGQRGCHQRVCRCWRWPPR